MANGRQRRIRKEYAKVMKRDKSPVNCYAHGKKTNVGDIANQK